MKWVLKDQSGFTLVEMIIVIIIMGIMAAVVIPQIGTTSDDAKLSAVKQDLTSMRNAVEIYYSQHNSAYPGARLNDGSGVVSTAAEAATAFVEQLTQYTDVNGDCQATKDATHKYGPYIKLNCAALPAALLESELFGYVKGAFTDAKRDKPGQFCLANGGTLLLDEISEMDIALQVKLLRVLNNGEYQPLGSTKAMHTDARILAATNADLRECIEQGTFREDLYFRINVVELTIPPLRERPNDIAILADHFLRKFQRKTGKPIERLSPEAIAALRKYPFPGNVRELENAVEHAFVMCHGEVIEARHLPVTITRESGAVNGVTPVRKHEKDVILETLRRHQGNRTRAAQELGIHRSTLWRKVKSYGLDSEAG